VHDYGSIHFESTRIEAQAVANNYRSQLVFCLVSITVADETTALQQTRRLVAVWLSASRVHKMLGAKLGFRVLITSTDLLPSAAGFGPSAMLAVPPPDTTRQALLCSYPSWTANRHAATGVESPNYCLTDSMLRISSWTRTMARLYQ
jgi:hypothetical protein